LLKNPLAEIAREEKPVRSIRPERGSSTKMSN